jgi:hypothetical protein
VWGGRQTSIFLKTWWQSHHVFKKIDVCLPILRVFKINCIYGAKQLR